jgi:FAD:protein FMN transferase
MSTPSAMGGERLLVQQSGRPMATDVSVQISASPEQSRVAEEAAVACMNWFAEVDARLSRFQGESELSRLNRSGGHWFVASPLLFAAVTIAVQSAEASSGRFDPTLLGQILALGYDRDFEEIAQREIGSARNDLAPAPLSPGAWRDIQLDPAGRRIRLPQHAQLDLGGIAKGWAADVALHRFCLPFAGALINVGGDIRVSGGPAPGENWSVGIRDPRRELAPTAGTPSSPSYVATLTFSRGGLATSGAVRRWWLRDGRRQHHLLDPQTGRPMELWTLDGETPLAGHDGNQAAALLATATALAPTAARAEVAAKVALLRGYPEALRAVDAAWERPSALTAPVDADVAVALVLTFGNGEVAISENLPAYLSSWGTQDAPLPITPVAPPQDRSSPLRLS